MKLLTINVLIVLWLNSCQSKISTDIELHDQKDSVQANKLVIDDLGLSWEELNRCNCLFAINNDRYWNKYHFFARDSVGDYGIIKLTDHKERLKIPVSNSYHSTHRTKGEEWAESFVNDSIKIEIKGSPIDSRILNTYSYLVDFVMIHKNDTTKQRIIGHCNY